MELFATRCPWWVAGPGIGLLIAGLLWAANRPLGVIGGFDDLQALLRKRSGGLSWRILFLLGIAGGGFLSAISAGGFRPTFAAGSFELGLGASPALKFAALFGGGLLMGYGGRTSGGCTLGHGMCGTALGSTASLVGTATFMATAVAVTQLLARVFP